MSSTNSPDEVPSPSSLSSVDRRTLLLFLVGFCCVGFFFADVATPIYFDSPFPAMLSLGVVTAQLTVICVWGTLVRGTFWIRLPWTLLLLVLSWCGFAWGVMIENGRPNTESMLSIAMLWMFGFITSFVPLKIAAWCFRWQIVQDSGNEKTVDSSSRYAIRDIMIGTLLLAISMGIGRVMLPSDDISLAQFVRANPLRQPELVVAITIYGIVSLLVKLPCIWISLGQKVEKIKTSIGVWVIYCLGLAIVELVLLVAVLGDPGGNTGEVFLGIIVSHQLMGAIMLGICLALRGMGYRLQRSLERQEVQEFGRRDSPTESD